MVISVVIPMYGPVGHTTECLRALNTTRDLEVVLVDNQPSSISARLYDQADLVIRNRTNKGFGYGSNQGASLSTGDVIVFLNNDTIPNRPGWLAPLAQAAQEHGIAGPKLVYPDQRIQHAGVRLYVDNGTLTAENIGRGDPDNGQHDTPGPVEAVTGACMAVRRDVFFKVSGFDVGYWNGYEDIDLCLRAGGAWYEPGSVVVHHESAAGPERWTRVRENVDRLNERWLGRYTDADERLHQHGSVEVVPGD